MSMLIRVTATIIAFLLLNACSGGGSSGANSTRAPDSAQTAPDIAAPSNDAGEPASQAEEPECNVRVIGTAPADDDTRARSESTRESQAADQRSGLSPDIGISAISRRCLKRLQHGALAQTVKALAAFGQPSGRLRARSLPEAPTRFAGAEHLVAQRLLPLEDLLHHRQRRRRHVLQHRA